MNISTFTYLCETTSTCGKTDEFNAGTLFRLTRVMDGVQKDRAYDDTFIMYGPVTDINSPKYGAKDRALKISSFAVQLPELDVPDLPTPP